MLSTTKAVQGALEQIDAAVQIIEAYCDEYGGWGGEDDDAKTATDLGLRLTGLSWPCAIGGRAFAEGDGERPWAVASRDSDLTKEDR